MIEHYILNIVGYYSNISIHRVHRILRRLLQSTDINEVYTIMEHLEHQKILSGDLVGYMTEEQEADIQHIHKYDYSNIEKNYSLTNFGIRCTLIDKSFTKKLDPGWIVCDYNSISK